MEANNQTEQTTQETTTQETVTQETTTQETTTTQNGNDGFTRVVRSKMGKFSVTPKISLDKFKNLFSNKTMSYFDKRGNQMEYDNEGVHKRYSEEITETNGKSRTRYVVIMKTYINLMGDMITFTWDNEEASFYTKFNHPDLSNFGGKMFWKNA